MALLSCAIFAQEKVPPHLLRILSIGDPPPFVQEVRNGARYEVPPPEGSIPPRTLTIASRTVPGKEGEPAPLPLRLRLGHLSSPVALPLLESRQILINRDQGSKWLSLQVPPVEASLALVCRGPKDWNEPRAIILPDGPLQRAEGTVHFANLSSLTVGVVLGDEKIRLDPGAVFSRVIARNGPAQSLTISYAADGGLETCLSSLLEPTPHGIKRIIVYTADGTRPRSPVKVFQLDETFGN